MSELIRDALALACGEGVNVVRSVLQGDEPSTAFTLAIGAGVLTIDITGMLWLNENAPGWEDHVKFKGVTIQKEVTMADAKGAEQYRGVDHLVSEIEQSLVHQVATAIIEKSTIEIEREMR